MRLFFTLALLIVVVTATAQIPSKHSFRLLNSLYDEQNPVLSPDGKALYFTIGNHPENIGGKRDPGDIWISRRLGDQWSAPVHGGSLLNNQGYNAVAGISSRGDQLFLHGHYAANGDPARSQGVSISSDNGGGWSRPINISIPYYQNRSALISGSISADGSVFVFAAETYGSHGVEDIYVSFNRAGKWSGPINLGNTINTQFQELSPSLSADKQTLYFSSNGRKGSGSFDVYSASRLDSTWTNWSKPVNMGGRINTSGRELYFRLHPELGFGVFASTLNSDGYGDVRLYVPEEPFLQKDTVVVADQTLSADTVVRITEKINDPAIKSHFVKVYGKVVNSKTGEPVIAKISFAGPEGEKLTTSSSEGYSVDVPSTDEYNITIEARGYVSTMQKLDINTLEMQALEMNFSLQPAEVGTTVNLKNVLFAQAKTDILPESYPELDLVVNFLKANPNIRIELSGHTDGRGVHVDNVRLSQQRVNKVKEYLVSKGVEARRISGKGYGGTRPIASNDTEESRRMNRRVEFTIKKS